ncbi:MAG TPA: DUF3224 domain-containing protein [Pseudoxanthomonas sp.]|jgi:Protein of unknown function (DUF3224).|nr:DUF3224 domain-containing protein [Pseudoxanthomonas sp.]
MSRERSAETTRARANVRVRDSEVVPFDDEDPALVEIHLREIFEGDIEARSDVRALQVRHEDGSARMVSLQRVRGTLHGRAGTFVLQGAEIVSDGKISATWFVIPGSGTGDLARLRGEGGFEGSFGQGSAATLDYWFER